MKASRNSLFVIILAVLVGAALFLVDRPVQAVAPIHTLGGDCSADRATGDLYVSADSYCITQPGTETGTITVRHGKGHRNDDDLTVAVPSPTGSDTPVIIDDGGVDTGSTGGTGGSGTGGSNTNQGNHYGNDKPDQNSHESKNKHDGEQTASDHHNTNERNDENKKDK